MHVPQSLTKAKFRLVISTLVSRPCWVKTSLCCSCRQFCESLPIHEPKIVWLQTVHTVKGTTVAGGKDLDISLLQHWPAQALKKGKFASGHCERPCCSVA